MTIHLPEDLQNFVQTKVECGQYASVDEAITEAVRLLRQSEVRRSVSRTMTPDELNRQLLADGLLSQIPTRLDPASYREFSPIAIEGEPLSETVIRERR